MTTDITKRTLTALCLLILCAICLSRDWLGPVLMMIEIKAFQELSEFHPAQGIEVFLDWFVFFSLLLLAESPSLVRFLVYSTWFIAWTVGVLGQCHGPALERAVLHASFIHWISAMCVIQSGLIQANHHQGWFLFPCLMVIINDTSAYLLGCRWGRRPLFSQSPNKTLEGYLLAIPCTVLLGLVVAAWMGLDSTSSLKIALFASTVAPFAGFFTSALKRARGFKDFGQCLPGHGGLVDRVDCQLFMAVFTFLLING